MNEILETVIIGSGPAGLTAALYAARADLAPLVLTGLNPGGQLMQTTEIDNFPGFPKGILGPDLMNNMMEQAKRFGAKIVPETAQSVDFSSQPLRVKTENAEYLSKTVILSMGADANWLDLPNAWRLRGKGVSSCATCDGFFFRGKELVVVGGGDSAMEEATFLTKFATKVTVVHRRSELRASKVMQERARSNPKIEFIFDTGIDDVLGTDNVTGVLLKDLKTGETREFACGGLFLAIGHTPSTKFLAGQVEVDAMGYVVLKEHTMTSVPGVFVGGDVNDTRYKQAISAAGMGCQAALDAEKWLEAQK